jgi:RNA polymerase sigma-70 factor (ECF subfamily)
LIADSDFALLDRIEAGGERAFDELVNRHQKVVYYMVLRIVGNHDDAADITQRSFVKAFGEIRKFRRRSSFRTWLCRIAINLSRNHLRSARGREMVPLTEMQADRGETAPEALLRKERDRKVREAIRELPEKQRLTLILRAYHNMSHREIGRALGISENSARANYFHALKGLKTRLTGMDGIDEV